MAICRCSSRTRTAARVEKNACMQLVCADAAHVPHQYSNAGAAMHFYLGSSLPFSCGARRSAAQRRHSGVAPSRRLQYARRDELWAVLVV